MTRTWGIGFWVLFGFPLVMLGQYTPPILDDSFGRALPGAPGLSVWWCEATYKVGRGRAAPTNTSDAVEIAAARNEYEPFQIVLRPSVNFSNLTVAVSDLILQGGPGTASIAASNVEICVAEYVPVATASDFFGVAGPHPDPLVPVTNALYVFAGPNKPFWFTVYVPKDAPAGDYTGSVSIQSGLTQVIVPLRLHVFDFSLSDVTHTETAYFVTVEPEWHMPSNATEVAALWDMYMETFRRHRISPYSPHLYAPITWNLTNEEFTIDFTKFDAAMTRYLDEFNFNSFNLFGHKSPPLPQNLGGHAPFSPGYRRLFSKLMKPIMAHLEGRGWKEKAYCYWYDEPQPEAYPFVISGMQALREAAPGLRRFLTETYEPALYPYVDMWAPWISSHDGTRAQDRIASGAEVWWYVCIGPPAPFANNFIDHPPINHRIRPWFAEKLGASGELYWSTTWWRGTNGLPRNPWTSTSNGSLLTAGNGDGVLLYPPVRSLPSGPVLAGPINSLRLELIREGMEDGEYFWLLKEALQRGQARLDAGHPAVLEGNAARAAAVALITSLVEYEKNPQNLYLARRRIAEAIEALDDGAPFIVRQPSPLVVSLNGSSVLRTEALGWPLPGYQWCFNGTNIDGATNASLVLSNIVTAHAGDYTVIASNAAGVATSAVAKVVGDWSATPDILLQPEGLVRRVGDTAIFSVSAVSTNPIGYQWLFRGTPVTGTSNLSLVITNLSGGHAGDYSVILSNASGVVTSAVAHLTVSTPSSGAALILSGAPWRYYDQGIDLGTAWREPEYDDSGWKFAWGQFGYGEGDERTVVDFGWDPINKHPTTYFRCVFHSSGTTAEFAPEAIWHLDEASGVRNDSVGTNHFAVIGTVITNSPGKLGNAVSNTSAEVTELSAGDSPELSYTGPFTICGWMKVNSPDGEVDLLRKTNEFRLWYTGSVINRFRFSVGDGTNYVQDNTIGYVPGTWRFIVAWYDGTYAYIQQNGGTIYSNAISPPTDTDSPLTAARIYAANGSMAADEVCLLKRVLTAAERTYLYNGGAGQTLGPDSLPPYLIARLLRDDGAVVHLNGTEIFRDNMPAGAVSYATRALFDIGGINESNFLTFPVPLHLLRAGTNVIAVEVHQYTSGSSDLSFDFELGVTVPQPPQILAGPVSQVRRAGENAAFTVMAASGLPFTYNWLFNGAPLANATNDRIEVTDLTPEQSGNFRAVLSSAGGSVTSAPASLLVVDRYALIASWPKGGPGFILNVPGNTLPSTILISSNLVDWSEWFTLLPTAESISIIDLGSRNAPSRFYRLRVD